MSTKLDPAVLAAQARVALRDTLAAHAAPSPASERPVVVGEMEAAYSHTEKVALATLVHHILSPHLNEFTGDHGREVLNVMVQMGAALKLARAEKAASPTSPAVPSDREVEAAAEVLYSTHEPENYTAVALAALTAAYRTRGGQS